MKYFQIDRENQLLLVKASDGHYSIPETPPYPAPQAEALVYDLSEWAGEPALVWAAPAKTAADDAAAADIVRIPLRQTWSLLPHRDYALACHAATWLHWERTSRFCPICGAPLERHLPMGKRCPSCGAEHFPHLAPAIIVRIERRAPAGLADVPEGTPQILLVHARTFRRPSMFGLVAGFLEGGETHEECVSREVREETSLAVTNVRYFGSQPWPYPSGVMIGFTAQWAGGDVALADGELAEARWCDARHLPDVIPDPMSIARQLIDDWTRRTGQDTAQQV